VIVSTNRTLGILPLIVAGAAVAASGGGLWALWKDQEAEYEAWKRTVPLPKVPPAPAAPQTADQMKTWTPADADAAYRKLWEEWRENAIPAVPKDPESNTLLWAAAAVGTLSLFLIWRSK